MDISSVITNVTKALKANAPEIFTGLGIAGVITTSYLASKAGKKHSAIVSEEPKELSIKEEAKMVWKVYIPVGIAGAFTIGCIVGASKTNGNRTAAAVTAYSLTEKAFSEYKEKVVEEIGKGKERKIHDEIAQDRVNRTPPSGEVVILGGGHVLCCELLTHRYFRSDMEALRKAQNDLNALIINQIYVTLDEFYDILGLAYTSYSSHNGWDSNKMMELQFSTVMADNGEPCLAFDYNYVKPLH